jgi:hypothetical protein
LLSGCIKALSEKETREIIFTQIKHAKAIKTFERTNLFKKGSKKNVEGKRCNKKL